MTIITDAKGMLIAHEGLRLAPYIDTRGNITIGVGRNLSDRGITKAEALHLLANDIVFCAQELQRLLPWYSKLDNVRKLAFLDMVFNLGVTEFLNFKDMLAAAREQKWTRAATECLDSLWREQVGQRAANIANMLQTGEIPKELRDGISKLA